MAILLMLQGIAQGLRSILLLTGKHMALENPSDEKATNA
jgi:TRAP-type mannitol/chloroaromatic compound transport system permease small subunit